MYRCSVLIGCTDYTSCVPVSCTRCTAVVPFGCRAADTQSDTSSVSQASYDPNRPLFSHLSSEISDTIASPVEDAGGDDGDDGGIVLVSTKPRTDAGSTGTTVAQDR